MKKILPVVSLLSGILVFGLILGLATKEGVSQKNSTVTLYYYNESKDQGVGGTQCTKAGLAPVTRTIPRSATPIQDTLELLLIGGVTADEKNIGLTSFFPLDGVSLLNSSLIDGTLTLTFFDPNHKTSGGSCRTTILWSQIEATAKQFKEVKSVKFIPEELFQP